jgi:hypothetical protein
MDEELARKKLIDHLKTMAPRNRAETISDTTELYYDLGLYGDDIFEFVLWAHKELGIKPPFELRKYAPSEWASQPIYRLIAWLAGSSRRYQSFTVRHVLAAAKAGRWT